MRVELNAAVCNHMHEAKRLTGLAGVVAIALFALPAAGLAAPIPGECQLSKLPSGALSKICVPAAEWNGNLVVFLHGYVPNVAGGPALDFHDTLPDGTEASQLVQKLGYAFATTSYRQNGLVILEGVEDTRELLAEFESHHGPPEHRYVTGVSEGGLVAALFAEKRPSELTGAYAACAPIGSFHYQLKYIGDFRVLFDYFFPDVFTGTPVDIADLDVALWLNGHYPSLIERLLRQDEQRALELIQTSRAAYNPGDFSTVVSTTLGLLSYSILGTEDVKAKLGGSAYENRFRWYFGSSDDVSLNRGVQRFAAAPAATRALRAYETKGDLEVPMVSIHTTRDAIVPIAHELIYGAKVRADERGRFIPFPIFRYGHCNFTTAELIAGLAVLAAQP